MTTIPAVDVKKRGLRPTRSTSMAQKTLTTRASRVCPPFNCKIVRTYIKHEGENTYWNFLALLFDTHGLVNKIHVVAEKRVAAVLGDDTERNQDSKTISVALGSQEIHVAASLLELEFETECFLDFLVFELNGRVVDITICVVVCQRRQRLLGLVFRDVPTWRFGDPYCQ